ncbi:hypothetical protein NDU88_006812 [Pleurodeles waltl]|uniref:Uncharacterized protein n=1 Tax=Pleurodeles waltl TaxID=8319 RepID=A0AAV7MIE3_PLEWA|nr:hypothetical protein NDU88_006812 [Pleurodeles waltl]
MEGQQIERRPGKQRGRIRRSGRHGSGARGRSLVRAPEAGSASEQRRAPEAPFVVLFTGPINGVHETGRVRSGSRLLRPRGWVCRGPSEYTLIRLDASGEDPSEALRFFLMCIESGSIKRFAKVAALAQPPCGRRGAFWDGVLSHRGPDLS